MQFHCETEEKKKMVGSPMDWATSAVWPFHALVKELSRGLSQRRQLIVELHRPVQASPRHY